MSIALLTPVPWEHLKDGEDVCQRQGKVAFGSNAFEELLKFEQEGGKGMHVLIYSSHKDHPTAAKVTWRATFVGMVKSEDFSNADRNKYRPPSCSAEDNDSTWTGWGCFYEVAGLEELSEDEAIPINKVKRKNGRGHASTFVPRGPTIVTDPWE
jgi:hypothetical protein